jgi:branched-chain amino acid transport system substrate-binding protein
MFTRRSFLQSSAAAAALAASASSARADNAPGVTDAEIKIGQTMPYSGPASAYGVIGRTEAAYFKMINEQGGVNGRKIDLISLDDGYSPPKTVEQVRRLVEEEQVAFLFNTLGTPPNAAIRQYLNDNKVPQLFVSTGASMFSDPKHFPWTMGSTRTIRPRRTSTANIFSAPSRMPKSVCSIRTTASARIISSV